jgi:hypothetical protein
MAVALQYYNEEGPFAGQYTMKKPIEAYRNNESHTWSAGTGGLVGTDCDCDRGVPRASDATRHTPDIYARLGRYCSPTALAPSPL